MRPAIAEKGFVMAQGERGVIYARVRGEGVWCVSTHDSGWRMVYVGLGTSSKSVSGLVGCGQILLHWSQLDVTFRPNRPGILGSAYFDGECWYLRPMDRGHDDVFEGLFGWVEDGFIREIELMRAGVDHGRDTSCFEYPPALKNAVC